MWDFVNNYLCSLITMISGILFVKYPLNIKIQLKRNVSIFLIFFFSFVASLFFFLSNPFFKTLCFCLLYFIYFRYVFKLNGYKSLISSIIFMTILTVSEIVVFIVLSNILNLNNSYLYNSFGGSLFSNFIINFLGIIIGLIFKKFLIKVLNIKLKNVLMIYVVVLFLCIIFFFYATFSNIGNGLNLISGIMAIFVLLVVIVNLFIQIYKNNELMFKYDKLLEFIKKYEIEIDNQRTMRHEIKNQLLTIKSKIVDKDNNDSIIDYIDEILEDNNREINHTLYAKLNCLPPNGIKGLFYFKVSEAIENGIDIDINISKEIRYSILNDLSSIMFNQVGKLFGILLDNAIEASRVTENKKMGIEIYAVDNKVNFIVSNTYNGKINSTIGMFSRSSKGNNRGHGLFLAKFLVNNNDKFVLDTTITDDLYIQKLVIK